MTRRKPKAPPLPSLKANALPGERATVRNIDAPAIAERRVKAFQLRKAGLGYREIAKATGVAVETAWVDVQSELRALRELTVHAAEEVRELELKRLDDYLTRLAGRIAKGEPNAIRTALMCQERRAKLLGLDAALKVSVETDKQTALAKLSDDTLERALADVVH